MQQTDQRRRENVGTCEVKVVVNAAMVRASGVDGSVRRLGHRREVVVAGPPTSRARRRRQMDAPPWQSYFLVFEKNKYVKSDSWSMDLSGEDDYS